MNIGRPCHPALCRCLLLQILQQLPPDVPSSSTASTSSSSQSLPAPQANVWAELAQQNIAPHMWAELERLGIDLNAVCEALSRNNGDVSAALAELIGESEAGEGASVCVLIILNKNKTEEKKRMTAGR